MLQPYAGKDVGLKRTACTKSLTWAARCNTWLLIKLMPKGVVFPFRFFSFMYKEHVGFAQREKDAHNGYE